MSMEYTELGKALTRSSRAAYLNATIKEQLDESIGYLLKNADIPPAVDNLMLLGIFTNIDLLGFLSTGRGHSKDAVAFIKEYFSRVDKRYEGIGGLLYYCLRHGYVHLATPKRIKLRDGKVMDFSFAWRHRRRDHLKLHKTKELLRSGERVTIYRLLIAVNILYKDLLSAIDYYADDICSNQDICDTFWKSFSTRRDPEKETEEAIIKCKYVKKSDFSSIRRRISKT